MTSDPNKLQDSPKENDRLEKLRSLDLLDTEPEAIFEELTQLAAYTCDMPVSLISLIDRDRQWFKSRFNWNDEFTSRSISFCQYTILGSDIFEVKDATQNKLFSNNPLVTQNPAIRYYAGMPLFTRDGYALGSICVIDFKKNQLSEKQKDALRTIGHQVEVLAQMRKKSRDELLKNRSSTSLLEQKLKYQEHVLQDIDAINSQPELTKLDRKRIDNLISDIQLYSDIEQNGLVKKFTRIELTKALNQWKKKEAGGLSLMLAEDLPEQVVVDWSILRKMLQLTHSLMESGSEARLSVELSWKLQSLVKLSFSFSQPILDPDFSHSNRFELQRELINKILTFFNDELSVEEEDHRRLYSFEMQMALR